MDNKKQKIISILKEFSAWDTEERINLTNQYADEILASLVVDEDAIKCAWERYQALQDEYRKLTGKEYQWLK
jgi:hypothetical protein